MSSRRKPMTAGELIEQLQSDPEFRERERLREQHRRERAAEYDLATAPLKADLAELGFHVKSVADLYNQKIDYRRAIPVLLDWLPRVSHRAVKESIVRALTVPWAKPAAARPLVEEFRRLDADAQSSLRWAIGNALEVVADEAVFDDLVQFACDRSNGRAREMVVVALGNMRDPRAVDVLIGLLGDEEVAGHAVVGLGKLKAPEAREPLERFLNHPKSWLRREAKKALAKFSA